ncbi:hypothetical protein NEOKW01_0370 [Nematocida sp. AWRm80]|nr:hypothetical protein NEOKW01_0370 [Nematocida sp. AWRm80]
MFKLGISRKTYKRIAILSVFILVNYLGCVIGKDKKMKNDNNTLFKAEDRLEEAEIIINEELFLPGIFEEMPVRIPQKHFVHGYFYKRNDILLMDVTTYKMIRQIDVNEYSSLDSMYCDGTDSDALELAKSRFFDLNYNTFSLRNYRLVKIDDLSTKACIFNINILPEIDRTNLSTEAQYMTLMKTLLRINDKDIYHIVIEKENKNIELFNPEILECLCKHIYTIQGTIMLLELSNVSQKEAEYLLLLFPLAYTLENSSEYPVFLIFDNCDITSYSIIPSAHALSQSLNLVLVGEMRASLDLLDTLIYNIGLLDISKLSSNIDSLDNNGGVKSISPINLVVSDDKQAYYMNMSPVIHYNSLVDILYLRFDQLLDILQQVDCNTIICPTEQLVITDINETSSIRSQLEQLKKIDPKERLSINLLCNNVIMYVDIPGSVINTSLHHDLTDLIIELDFTDIVFCIMYAIVKKPTDSSITNPILNIQNLRISPNLAKMEVVKIYRTKEELEKLGRRVYLIANYAGNIIKMLLNRNIHAIQLSYKVYRKEFINKNTIIVLMSVSDYISIAHAPITSTSDLQDYPDLENHINDIIKEIKRKKAFICPGTCRRSILIKSNAIKNSSENITNSDTNSHNTYISIDTKGITHIAIHPSVGHICSECVQPQIKMKIKEFAERNNLKEEEINLVAGLLVLKEDCTVQLQLHKPEMEKNILQIFNKAGTPYVMVYSEETGSL